MEIENTDAKGELTVERPWFPEIPPSDEELQARALMQERYGRKSDGGERERPERTA
jgi:hypothetical protein